MPTKAKTTTKSKKTTAGKTAKSKLTDFNVVSEVFTTTEWEVEKIEVPPNTVLLFINGRSKGQVDTTDQTLKNFSTHAAQREGIKSFSVYRDGMKVTTADSEMPMSNITKLEIVTKDTRGSIWYD